MKNIMRISTSFSVSLLVLASFLGCTRPSQTTSKLSLALPTTMGSQRWGSQTFDEIAHVSINISGDGIYQPILFNWDGDEGKIVNGTAPVAPTTFNLEVPQGSNRLIQVLVVYKDSSTEGSMQFFYGDTNRNLNLPSEIIDIDVTALGTSTQIVDGQVMGRYFNSTAGGPTGKVDILYTAPGKPSMIIDRASMINGWFSFFMLSNVSFSYRLPDGTLLWDGPVDLNSAAFSAKSSVLRVSVPSHQTNRSWSGPASWRPENPQVFVYGWFGNSTALSGKVVCDTPTPSALTRVATGNSSSTLLSRTNAAPPTDLFNGALSSFYVQGGVAFGSAGSACLDATSIAAEKFKSILNFSANLIDGSGNDNAAGFRHSFVLSSDGNFLTISNSATGRTMNGTLLPGVSAYVDDYIVFKKSALEQPRTNFAPCGAIAGGQLGFAPAGMGTVTGDAVTINLNLTPEEATAGTLVAVCSRKNSMVSDSGFWMSPSYFKNMSPGGGSGPGSGTPYLRFEFDNSGFLNSPPGATLLTKDICHQVAARLYQNGMPYPYPTVGGLSLSGLSSSFGSFYTTGSCVTPITTTSIPHLASTSAPLFFKATSLVTSASLSVTLPDASISYGTSQPIFVENGKLRLNIPQKIAVGVCYPLNMEYIYAPGSGTYSSRIMSSSIASGFTMVPGSGGSFYTNMTCGTQTGTPNPIVNGLATVYYMASDSVSKTVSVSATGATQADPLPMTVTVGAGGAVINSIEVTPMMMGNLIPGQCNQIQLRLLNHDGAVVPASTPFSVTFSADIAGAPDIAGALYDNQGCSPSMGMAGSIGSMDGSGSASRFNSPSGLAVDSSGNVFVADRLNHTIRKITAAGVVTTLAGQSGVSGSVDGNGSSARFYIPTGLAVDSIGNVYVADTGNHTIRKITAGGAVTTFAGQSGVSGSTDATGSSARFNNPKGVAVDSSGNIYVADYFNHTIRKITPAGLVTTFAGMAGTNGSSDGIGTSARFFYPSGLTVDSGDNVYVADNSNHTIRKITSAGLVTTLAGMAGTSGYIDSGGTGARFNSPTGVTVDGSGNVYVADTMNHTIRTVTPAGVVSTLAGSSVGTSGSADGTGSAARFNSPTGVTVDGNNNIYVADTVNNTIRRITFGGVVTTLAGYSGPAIPAINNQVTFSAGSMTQYIGFVPGKANAIVNLTVASGARSISTPMTVSNPLAGGPGVDSNYLYAEPPTLNGKKIVGSHEFPKLVPLKFPSGATLMCSPNGSGFLPENCSGIVDGGLNYIWTASDAISNQERYFQISLPGGGPRTYKFRPSEIYGTTFKAYNCDHVQSTDTGFSQINSLYSGSVNVVCLGQTAPGVGVVVTKANGVDQISLIGDGGRALIGHTGGNTVNAAFLPVGGGNPNIPIGGDISTRGVVLANLNLTGLAGSDPFIGLIGTLVSASPNKQIRISGNTFALTGVGSMITYGIRSSPITEPDIEIQISNNNFTINSPQNPGGTTYGIALTDADVGTTWIKDNSFIGGGAAENCQTVGVSIESATRPVNFVTIENMKWQGNGCGIIATGSGGANVVSNLVIKNSNIELNTLPNPSLTALGVKLFNVASFTLSDNRVAWTDISPSAVIQNLVKIDSGGSASTGVFRNNVLATTKNPANNFLMINNSVITLNSFDHNQFVYTGSSSISTSVISNVSSIGLNRSSLQTHGNNLFCSGSANVWSSILQSASAGSFNESDANTSCKHANDVETTTNLCKTPCAP